VGIGDGVGVGAIVGIALGVGSSASDSDTAGVCIGKTTMSVMTAAIVMTKPISIPRPSQYSREKTCPARKKPFAMVDSICFILPIILLFIIWSLSVIYAHIVSSSFLFCNTIVVNFPRQNKKRYFAADMEIALLHFADRCGFCKQNVNTPKY